MMEREIARGGGHAAGGLREGGQPGCFQARTVQAPFVFDSTLLGRLIGVTHPRVGAPDNPAACASASAAARTVISQS